jgi:hypothetical protein
MNGGPTSGFRLHMASTLEKGREFSEGGDDKALPDYEADHILTGRGQNDGVPCPRRAG